MLLSFLSVAPIKAQEYKYEFVLVGVDSPAQAKGNINDLRELLGVKTFLFDNETNKFKMQSHLDFELIELAIDIESLGVIIDGEIIKSIL